VYAPLVATVASVGLPVRSVYAPLVATVDKVGLLMMGIVAPPFETDVVVQSTWVGTLGTVNLMDMMPFNVRR
jgi:hypothetical protein